VALKKLTWFTKGLRLGCVSPQHPHSKVKETDLIYEGIATLIPSHMISLYEMEKETDLIYEGIATILG